MSTISLAIMVRDDAKRLRRAIASAKNAVDEIVVLDTGSKDDSVEVARAEGAKVTQIEWPNNFSQALNTLLENVQTDWVLRLDSDEWFEDDPSDNVRGCAADPDAFAFRFVRRDIRPEGGYEEISLIRFWRHHPDLKYRGLVHENIPSASFQQVWPTKVEKIAPVWFWHDGYGSGHLEKIRRNVPLMEKELEEHPGQPYYQAMLAKGYKDIDDPRWRKVMNEIIDQALEGDRPSTPILSVIFADVLNSIDGPELREARTDQIVMKALQSFGRTPPVLVAISNLELRRSRKREALEVLLILEQMATTGNYDRSMPVNPDLFGKPFWKHLDHLADQLGRWEICKRCEEHL